MADAGTVGSLVSAVFETGGYIYQSHFLNELTSAMKGSLGGFVYLIGIAAAIFSVATRGDFRLVVWLLIGPPLFFSVILPRENISSANWKFANQGRNQEEVDREVHRMVEKNGEGDNSMKVSVLFLKYNRLVSATVQEVVKVINNNKVDTDKLFIRKGQWFSQIYSKNADEQGLRDFIQSVFFGQCGEYIAAAKILGDDQYVGPERAAAQKKFEGFGNTNIKLTPQAAQYIAGLEIRGGGGNKGGTADEQQNLAKRVTELREQKVSCKGVWEHLLVALEDFGKRTVQDLQRHAQINDIDIDRFNEELSKAATGSKNAAESTDLLAKIVAKYVLRNELFRGSYTGAINRIAQSGRESPTAMVAPEPEVAQVENARVAQQEWMEKTRLLESASTLPYYQGLGLFLLGSTFPFFAMLLLVPGKHAAFINWFLLWLWLKSWDIGFAVVMQLDDLLFSLLAFHKRPYQGEEFLKSDFFAAMYSMHILDPTFNMGTYYNVLAVCMMAVPVISSQLILGALTGGAGMVADGIAMSAKEIGQGAFTTVGQYATTSLRFQQHDLKASRVQAYNDAVSGRQVLSSAERASFSSGSAEQRAKIMQNWGRPNQQTLAEDMVGRTASQLAGRPAPVPYAASGPNGSTRTVSGPQDEQYDSAASHSKWRGFFGGLAAPPTANAGGIGLRMSFDPTNPVFADPKMRSGIRSLMNTLQNASDVASDIHGAYVSEIMGNISAEDRARMAQAVYDENYSRESQELAKRSSWRRSLEVPWISASAALEEGDYEMAAMKNFAGVVSSYLRGLGQLAGEAGDVQTSISNIRGSWQANSEYQALAGKLKSMNISDDFIKSLNPHDENFSKTLEGIINGQKGGMSEQLEALWRKAGK